MIKPVPCNATAYLQTVNTTPCGPLIPSDFDPLALAPEVRAAQLAHFNLPAEPDQARYPDLHRFWTDLFSQPLTFVTGELAYSTKPEKAPPGFRRGGVTTRQQSSGNWSGASLLARDGRMFTDVMATWLVPDVSVPEGADETVEYKSSCWVGLDGQRSYPDATLPQIGTEQSINKGGVQAPPAVVTWFQWWPMDEMLIPIETLPVTFGDRVYCWLTATSYTQVRCIIKVVSEAPGSGATGRLMRFCAKAPDIRYPPLISAYSPKISGATAEWVTEAPTSKVTQQLFPLPDYGQVTFEHCYALSAPDPGDPYRLEPLTGPTLMRMFKIDGTRRVTISTADRPGDVPALNMVVTTFTG